MNHAYRLVWNRAKRVMLPVGVAVFAFQAQAAICTPDATYCGVAGLNGVQGTGPGEVGTNGTDGQTTFVIASGTGSIASDLVVVGGVGGHGGAGSDQELCSGSYCRVGDGGDGGDGADAIQLGAATFAFALGQGARIEGGDGGNAGDSGYASGAFLGEVGNAGNGGDGLEQAPGSVQVSGGSDSAFIGGSGGNAGRGRAGAGNGGNGGNGIGLGSGAVLLLSTNARAMGGNGGDSASGVGGDGGTAIELGTGAMIVMGETVVRGGNGGASGHAFSSTGGIGGAGIDAGSGSITSHAQVSGGDGGNHLYIGEGGDGGDAFHGGSLDVVLTGGSVDGGEGGHGWDNTFLGNSSTAGGAGGDAFDVAALDLTVAAGIEVRGGDGGRGGITSVSQGGSGNTGGAAIRAGQLTLDLAAGASIAGGNGGAAGTGPSGNGASGTGGKAIVATAGASALVIAGNVSGGLSGDGATRATAIELSGGGNTLALQTGANILGDIVSTSGSTNGGDSLQLGGNGAGETTLTGSLRGFADYLKTDTGTWILAGTGDPAQDWTVLGGGTLIGDSDSVQGDLAINGGTFVFDQHDDGIYAGTASHSNLGWGGEAARIRKRGSATLTVTAGSTEVNWSLDEGALILGNGSTAALTADLFRGAAFTTAASTTLTVTAGYSLQGAAGGNGGDAPTQTVGGTGGAGSNHGSTDGTSNDGGDGGGSVALDGSAGQQPDPTSGVGAGGSGGRGYGGSMGGGGGGGGGGGVAIDLTGTLDNAGTVRGGNGGDGGRDSGVAEGGIGGGGGAAVHAAAGAIVINAASGQLDGGSGGDPVSGDIRRGGMGGSGVAGTQYAVYNEGSIVGGAGGDGSRGTGGSGLAGIGFSATNDGIIAGGHGGVSGNGGSGIAGMGFTVLNTGSIAGGNGGDEDITSAGDGGTGVVAIGNATVINAGSVAAGAAGANVFGPPRAAGNAVSFSGGGNTLEIRAGASFTGAVASSSGTTNGGDTLRLGGGVDASFDLGQLDTGGQFSGFNQYAKSGTGTWTLTGTGPADQDWTIDAGTLVGDSERLQGGALVDNGTLVFDQAADGTYAGSISGTGTLVKQGTGTLVLTGGNSFTGGTTIASGTLQVGSGTSGAIAGDIVDNGVLVFDRSDTFIFAGDISGSGAVVQQGGTLVLAGAATHTGGTMIAAGTLQVGNGGASGSIAGDIVDHGALVFDRSDATIFAGTISGTGALAQQGSGTLVLAGDNIFTGGTTIASGTLQVGSGTSGSIAGDVVDNGVLAFGRSDTFTFSGNISGSGALTQQGGTLVLTGDNTYSGGTTIATGILQVGNGGTTGSLDGDVVNDGSLAFDRSDDIAFGGAIGGSGSLVQQGDGILVLTGDNTFAGGTAIASGTLQVGDGGATGAIGSGDVVNDGSLVFDRSGTLAFGGAISGSGTLVQAGSGTVLLAGNSGAFSGDTLVTGGRLVIGSSSGNGAVLGGDVSVASGATIAGHGRIGGDLEVASGAHVGPGKSIGTLSIDGDATFAHGSVLDFDFGAPGADYADFGVSDSVDVGGDLTLEGAVLNITDTGDMGAGLYNLFTWDGALTLDNGGLAFGNTPGDGYTLQILTGARQINLLDTSGLTLNFWNANGLADGDHPGGGSGTWSAAAPRWTGADGSVTAAMQPQPGFAIFGGDAGVVTVDHADGAVRATGLQFASDGYTLAGEALTLVGDGDMPVIRVGGGSAAGAAMTATIDAALAGTDGLAKHDLGTLVLTADNTYTGGTMLRGGVLSVSADANLGAQTGAVTLDGGTLRVTGTAFGSTARDVVLGDAGGTLDVADADHSFVLGQALEGSGAFAKKGAGTLVLSGANTWSGGTTIAEGVLQVGNGGTEGAIAGDVVDNATLVFDRSDDIAFDGAISGSGTLAQRGAGTLVLSGNSTYTGGTTIASGTIQVGSGGVSGAIAGDVANDGVLAFDRSDDIIFGGTISGVGSLAQLGAGTLLLDGDNTYAGGTVIAAGILQVGNGGATGSLGGGDIANDGTLVFDRSDAFAVGAAVAGSGKLVQQGGGILVLTGDNSYGGGTIITSGVLQVGNGGGTGALGSGNVVDDGVLAFERGGILAFTGAISGSGSLVQRGAGTLVLDGDSSAFAGSTTISSGALIVGGVAGNGAALGGDVTVQAGATLGGHGNIGGDVVNAGVLAPGASIGTLTIDGNYTQTSTGVLAIEATADGQADGLLVQGTATLDGSMLVLAQDGDWRPRTDYAILTANGGVSGHFGATTSSLLFLDAVLGYSASGVSMSLQRNNIAFASVAASANQAAVAGAADNLGWGNTVYEALALLDAVAAPQALDALTGEFHASTRAALLGDGRHLREAIGQHLSQAGAGAGGWISGWGQWTRTDGNGNAASMDGDGQGFVAGADIALGSRARIGAVAGTGRRDVQADARASSADVDSRHLGVYASADAGSLRLQTGVARSWHQVEARRTVAFPGYDDTLRADYDASTTQVFADASRAFAIGDAELAPFLNLSRVRVLGDGFDEVGGDAALRVDAADSERSYATLGVRWSAAPGANESVQLRGSAAWMHAFGGDDAPMNHHRLLAGTDTFTAIGAPIGGDAFTLDAALRWQAAAGVAIDAGYNARFGNGARDQGARLSLDWRF